MDDYAAADAVGHRVVHGGARFVEPVVIEAEVLGAIEELRPLAPLHNEPALEAIRAAQTALPDVPHIAVFDTAFHSTIPAEVATYAIPRRWREESGVRRYGFHGIAVQSVVAQVEAERIVVCHLGGGCSVTAVLSGRSLDTSMGFSPLEGVPMATRSGSIDPGALIYLLRQRGLTVEELDESLEHESGLAALGGLDDPLGFAVYTYRIAGAVAHMAMALSGLDVLAFSGGVGENREDVRDAIAGRLRFLGDFSVEVAPGSRGARDRRGGGDTPGLAWPGIRPLGKPDRAFDERLPGLGRRPKRRLFRASVQRHSRHPFEDEHGLGVGEEHLVAVQPEAGRIERGTLGEKRLGSGLRPRLEGHDERESLRQPPVGADTQRAVMRVRTRFPTERRRRPDRLPAGEVDDQGGSALQPLIGRSRYAES